MNREISAAESSQATACGDADPQVVLQRRFGLSHFRTGQREIIDSVLGGRDTLAIMPTPRTVALLDQGNSDLPDNQCQHTKRQTVIHRGSAPKPSPCGAL